MRLRLKAWTGTPDFASRSPIVDRQRVVGERDQRDLHIQQRQFLRGHAASLALNEPVRSDPGMTRIFSAAMMSLRLPEGADVYSLADFKTQKADERTVKSTDPNL